jgi:hypothetical protein
MACPTDMTLSHVDYSIFSNFYHCRRVSIRVVFDVCVSASLQCKQVIHINLLSINQFFSPLEFVKEKVVVTDIEL